MINEKMRALGAKRSIIREIFEYGKARKSEIGEENVFDFSLGNPSVCAPDEVNDELVRLISTSPSIQLHGYTSAQGNYSVRASIAEYVNKTQGESVHPDCIYMTVGAAGALTATLTALVEVGEEVIVPAPYFPEYKVFIERCGGAIRAIPCFADTMGLDLAAIESAINANTAAVLINSPNNPTGKVYSEECITRLCDILKNKSKELGKTIYLISDEPYRELVYNGIKVPYVTKYYDDAIICYSFSKSLSIPGDRIGYVLLCPRATEFTSVYQAICGAARALGFVCAPSLLQKMIPACLGKTADVSVYDTNRRVLYEELKRMGYEPINPDGAFYLFVKAISGNSIEFCERAKKFELLLVPSDDFGCEGYVRISYCVSTEQIKRSLPAFRALAESYKTED